MADPFNPESFRDYLVKSNATGFNFEYFPSIDSTNLEARRYLRSTTAPHEKLLVADLQTGGRGRQGRSWQAPPATGLLCTLLLKPELPLEKLFLYTAAIGLAVQAETLTFTGVKLDLKWPNDLLREGRKVGGILAEIDLQDNRTWLALGFGLNISLSDVDFQEAGISDKATNLTPPGLFRVSREEFLAGVLGSFFELRERLRHNPADVFEYWQSKLVTLGNRVQVLQQDKVVLEGLATGVGEDGSLIIEGDAGQAHRVQAGDVSVRLPDGRYSV